MVLGSGAMGQGVLPHDLPEGLSVSQWSAVQEAYVKASNAEWFDGFGTSAAPTAPAEEQPMTVLASTAVSSDPGGSTAPALGRFWPL